jgi:hypothetical protein
MDRCNGILQYSYVQANEPLQRDSAVHILNLRHILLSSRLRSRTWCYITQDTHKMGIHLAAPLKTSRLWRVEYVWVTNKTSSIWNHRRSQWLLSLRHELSSSARTPGLWVRIPFEAWTAVWIYSAPCDGLIPHPLYIYIKKIIKRPRSIRAVQS